MKRILTIAVLAAVLLTCACSDGTKKPAVTQTTATEAPVAKAPALTLDDVNGVIDSVKAEYAEKAELKLSDGTVIVTEPKVPDITLETIQNGTATREQMLDYTKYIANIRRLACDRLASAFPDGNTVKLGKDDNGKELGTYIILDPVSAGFNNAVEVMYSLGSVTGNEDIGADIVIIHSNNVTYFNNSTKETKILCPSVTENEILAAIAKNIG